MSVLTLISPRHYPRGRSSRLTVYFAVICLCLFSFSESRGSKLRPHELDTQIRWNREQIRQLMRKYYQGVRDELVKIEFLSNGVLLPSLTPLDRIAQGLKFHKAIHLSDVRGDHLGTQLWSKHADPITRILDLNGRAPGAGQVSISDLDASADIHPDTVVVKHTALSRSKDAVPSSYSHIRDLLDAHFELGNEDSRHDGYVVLMRNNAQGVDRDHPLGIIAIPYSVPLSELQNSPQGLLTDNVTTELSSSRLRIAKENPAWQLPSKSTDGVHERAFAALNSQVLAVLEEGVLTWHQQMATYDPLNFSRYDVWAPVSRFLEDFSMSSNLRSRSENDLSDYLDIQRGILLALTHRTRSFSLDWGMHDFPEQIGDIRHAWQLAVIDMLSRPAEDFKPSGSLIVSHNKRVSGHKGILRFIDFLQGSNPSRLESVSIIGAINISPHSVSMREMISPAISADEIDSNWVQMSFDDNAFAGPRLALMPFLSSAITSTDNPTDMSKLYLHLNMRSHDSRQLSERFTSDILSLVGGDALLLEIMAQVLRSQLDDALDANQRINGHDSAEFASGVVSALTNTWRMGFAMDKYRRGNQHKLP